MATPMKTPSTSRITTSSTTMSTSKGTPGRRLVPLDSRQCREAIVALEKGRKMPTLTDRSGNTKLIIVTHYYVERDYVTQHKVLKNKKDGKRVVPCDGDGDILLKDVAKKHFLSAPTSTLVNEGIIDDLLDRIGVQYFLYPSTADRLLDIVASAAQEVNMQWRAPVVAAGAGGGDGVNRQLLPGGGAATGGGGGRLKTTGLVASDMDPGVGGGGGAGMMGQYQYQHQLGGAASGLGGGRGGRDGGLKTTGLDDDGAGAWDRGTGGGGYGAAGRTPVRHRHIVEASPHIFSPEQKVAMEQAKAERAVAEAEAAKDRKAIANALAGIAVTVGDMGNTVVQHTGQIGDLKGGQQDLQEGQDLHASQIGDLQGGQKTLQDRVEKLEIQGQTSAQLADESVQHQTELKNYVDVGQTQLKNYMDMRLGPLPPAT